MFYRILCVFLVSFLAHSQTINSFTPKKIEQVKEEQLLQQAVISYKFWYPAVSAEAIFNGYREKNILDNQSIAILAATPKQIGFTLNSDTPYGGATLDLKNGPLVIDIPAGPYIALVDDHYQRWVADMGLPGPDQGQGGKYLIVPPQYNNPLPKGYHVAQASTYKLILGIRALPQNGNILGALNHLRQIKIYPLNTPTLQLIPYIDASKIYMDTSPLRWETTLEYWKQLDKIINEEPLLDEFKPMYGLLASLGIEKGKPFNPDERLKNILTKAALIGHEQMILSAFANDSAEVLVWPDRNWQWIGLVSDNGNFEMPWGLHLNARDRWFAQAIGASPAMFARKPGAGSLYWLGVKDDQKRYLDGSKSYQLTIPQPVPARLFWSVTVYDIETRSQISTDQNKAVLGSLLDFKITSKDKEITLYFGPKPPANKNQYWIKTIPGKAWFAYIRIYGPEEAAFDGSWKPGDFKKVHD